MSTQIPQRLDADHRRFVVAREPHLLHCHHYNTFLLRSILDAHFVDSLPFLVGAGNEVAFHQLSALFKEADLQDVGARKELAAELYRWAGFGVLDLSTLTEEGGTLQTAHSHYSMAWNAKFGTADAPMDHFTAGWLSGALAAIYDRPQGQFAVRQTDDMAAGAALNRFTLEGNGDPNYTVFASPGLGPLTTHEPRPVPETPVDYDGIFAALSGMDISGDPQGVIPAFGVYLTRHYANYYNRISFEFLREMDAQFGEMGVEIAEPLLVEAGHVCAFNTFGG
ncbi:MAG TPA: hypothetical protein ENK18_13175, partial [Deltaproteobacteria bacterium]|nr:hypothetical protein [Deltaproteobacteria bacterium]